MLSKATNTRCVLIQFTIRFGWSLECFTSRPGWELSDVASMQIILYYLNYQVFVGFFNTHILCIKLSVVTVLVFISCWFWERFWSYSYFLDFEWNSYHIPKMADLADKGCFLVVSIYMHWKQGWPYIPGKQSMVLLFHFLIAQPITLRNFS